MLVAFITLVLVVGLAWLTRSLEGKEVTAHAYRARGALLTPAELRFYASLREVVPDWAMVCPKVRLADLVACEKGNFGWAAFNRISGKHVDFVLVHRVTTRPVVAIELDDRSHERASSAVSDRLKDHAMASAGIRLVRIRAAGGYDAAELRAALALSAWPNCGRRAA